MQFTDVWIFKSPKLTPLLELPPCSSWFTNYIPLFEMAGSESNISVTWIWHDLRFLPNKPYLPTSLGLWRGFRSRKCEQQGGAWLPHPLPPWEWPTPTQVVHVGFPEDPRLLGEPRGWHLLPGHDGGTLTRSGVKPSNELSCIQVGIIVTKGVLRYICKCSKA